MHDHQTTGDAKEFLATLGGALEPRTAADHDIALQRGLARIWRIAPLPGGRGRPAGPDRGYNPEIGRNLITVIEGMVCLSNDIYPSRELATLFAKREELRARSKHNLLAIVHPQNCLRPFDPLHTIGQSLLPLPLLRSYFYPGHAQALLAGTFDLNCVHCGNEPEGGWSKAWFMGLMVSLYLGFKWHGKMAVSESFPGWFDEEPLYALGPVADIDLKLPGSQSNLVNEGVTDLKLPALTRDWTSWKEAQKTRSHWVRGWPSLPAGEVAFETYASWILSSLGLYRGAHDGRLHEDGSLEALLAGNEHELRSYLHELQNLAAEYLPTLCAVLKEVPGFPVSTEISAAWGAMMRQLLWQHRCGVDSQGREKEGKCALAKYPIESWIPDEARLTPRELAIRLSENMPRFRELTSLLWMFFIDDPTRLSHPSERRTARSRTGAAQGNGGVHRT